jgi:hypothetical protein
MTLDIVTAFPSSPEGEAMLDDSVGALTQSLFSASASTQQTFEKLIPKLQQYQDQANLFSTHLTGYQKSLTNALRSTSYQLKRGLMESTRLTNGISDAAANKVIQAIMQHMNKANASIIKAIMKKDMLRFTMQAEPKVITAMARNIQSKTQKSLAVMTVADKIALNAKSIQDHSKNVVEKAERAHLAKASPVIHEGVGKIKSILEIEKRVIPYKPVSVEDISPRKIGTDLGEAYVATSNAIDHAENALSLSGSARSREIVDLRDQLRSALDSQRDAVRIQRNLTDSAIRDELIPFNLQVSKVVTKDLIPAMKSFEENNEKIIKEIDRGRVNDIMHRLELKMKARSIEFAPLVSFEITCRRTAVGNFL